MNNVSRSAPRRRFAAAAAALAGLAACGSPPPPDTDAFRVRAVAFPGAAGSAQPRLTVGSDGLAVLSWLEPTDGGVAFRYATFDGEAFSAPREVVRGADLMANWADLPSVQPIAAEVWAAHWLRLDPQAPGAYRATVPAGWWWPFPTEGAERAVQVPEIGHQLVEMDVAPRR